MVTALAVAQAQHPAFEVAVVKRNNSGGATSGSRTTPGRVTITNQPLRTIIRSAYGGHELEVLGGPTWIESQRGPVEVVVIDSVERPVED